MFRTLFYSYVVSLLMLCVWFMPNNATAQRPTNSTLAYSPAFASILRDSYPSLVQGDYLRVDSCRKIISLRLYFERYETWESDKFTINALSYFPNLDTLIIYGDSSTIGALPTLPSRLKSLYIAHCGLERLPPLPAKLQWLDCSYNKLTILPDKLPAGLQQLDCSSNRLTALPASLPAKLQVLNCSDNQLTALPAVLPQYLVLLLCSYNPITQLPALPSSLQMLHLISTQVKCLPIHSQYLTVIPSNLPLCK